MEAFIQTINPYSILPLSSSLLLLFIVISIICKYTKERLTLAVLFFCVCISFWMFSSAVMLLFSDKDVSDLMIITYFLGWLLIPFAFCAVVTVFISMQRRFLYLCGLIYAALFAALVIFDFAYVEKTYFGFYPRIRYPFSLIVNCVYFSTVSFYLTKLYVFFISTGDNIKRNQARFMWIGMSLGFMVALTESIYIITQRPASFTKSISMTTYLTNAALIGGIVVSYVVVIAAYTVHVRSGMKRLPFLKSSGIYLVITLCFNTALSYFLIHYAYPVYPISSVGVLATTYIISYAIVKYRLIDITELLRTFIIYILLSVVFLGFYILALLLMGKGTFDIVTIVFFAMLVLWFFNPIQTRIQGLLGRYLFSAKRDYQRTIRDVSMKLVTYLDYHTIVELIRDTIVNTMRASSFTMLLFDYNDESYQPAIVHGPVDTGEKLKFLPTDESIRILRLVNREIFRDELVEKSAEDSTNEYLDLFDRLKAVLVVPMTYKGTIRGILCLGDKETGNIYTQEDVELLQILSNQAIIAIDNARLYSLAITDELTNLFIQRFFNQRIHEEIVSSVRFKRSLSLLIADIDHFKSVNDTYGHQTGDLVLRVIAGIIKEQVRTNDIVSRYGGEEFAIILPETENDVAQMIAERIRRKIEDNVFKDNIRCTISIGISTIDGASSFDAAKTNYERPDEWKGVFEKIKADFIAHADAALYTAKREGRNKTINNGRLEV